MGTRVVNAQAIRFGSRYERRPKATSAKRAEFALALEKKGIERSRSPKVPVAANWLASNDPNFLVEKRKQIRLRAKAEAQAKANPAIVARYAKAMRLV